jgi:GAF domain-containing protein
MILPPTPTVLGLPSGHPSLTSFLGVPLINDGQAIGIVAVGNRDGGYTQEELETLETLTTAMVEALQRKRAQEAPRKAREELEIRVQERTTELHVTLTGLWRRA